MERINLTKNINKIENMTVLDAIEIIKINMLYHLGQDGYIGAMDMAIKALSDPKKYMSKYAGDFYQDVVYCDECIYWDYNVDKISGRCSNWNDLSLSDRMIPIAYAKDFCSYGER